MQVKLDLHIHSEYSPDGRMTVDEIVAAVRAQGLQGAAICDHDRYAAGQLERTDFLLIGGEEFSTPYGHLLGLFLTDPVPDPDFSGSADDKINAFGRLVRAIHSQEGLAVLAHPFEHSQTTERFEAILPLLDGIETWNGRANRKNRQANRQAAELARSLGLPGTGGSDAHVLQEIGNGYVILDVPELSFSCVKEALRRPGNRVEGKEGRSRYVAASQFTRRRKTGAAFRSYAKWAAFAAKCCIEDIVRRR